MCALRLSAGLLGSLSLFGTTPSALEISERRLELFDINRGFSFLHISKCGGSSFVSWALDHDEIFQPLFYPTTFQGHEHGGKYDLIHRPNSTRLLMLRSPRSHVLSLFAECKYSRWGKQVIKSREAAHQPSVPHNGTHSEDFKIWIDHYFYQPGEEWFGCYQPWNYQAFQMLSTQANPHRLDRNRRSYEPNIDDAKRMCREMDWVGLTDFFHESLCLLLSRSRHQDIDSLNYFAGKCGCTAHGVSWAKRGDDKHDTHGINSSDVSVSLSTYSKIDRISSVDRQLFMFALGDFFSEMKLLENRLGRRVLCDETLRAKSSELSYVVGDLLLFYHNASVTVSGGF